MTTKPYINLQTDLLKHAINGPSHRKIFNGQIQSANYHGIIQDSPGALYLIPDHFWWMGSIPTEPSGLEFVFTTITGALEGFDTYGEHIINRYDFFDIKETTKQLSGKAETFLTFSDAYYNKKLFKPLGPLTDDYTFMELTKVNDKHTFKQLIVINTGALMMPVAYILPTRILEEE